MLGIVILLFGNFNNRFNFWPGTYIYHNNDDKDDADNSDDDNSDNTLTDNGSGKGVYFEPYHTEVKVAKLNISGGGSSYKLSDTTGQLFQAYSKQNNANELRKHTEDSVYVLDFSMKKDSHFRFGKGNRDNTTTFKLNKKPLWDMDIETGATALDFDLTPFRVRNFKINGGAASFDVKLGMPEAVTNVDISTGVSSVHINVPKDAACKITTDSGLTSNSFEGFNKTNDDDYETPGFTAAKKKIYIKFDGGVSDFKVTRY